MTVVPVRREDRIRLTTPHAGALLGVNTIMREQRQRLVLVWIGRACAVAAAGLVAFASWKLQPAEAIAARGGAKPPVFEASPHITAENWSVFAAKQGAAPERGAEEGRSQRFRLAGTFFALGEGAAERRKAILDDSETKQQSIIGEGESIEGWTVHEVAEDYAVLTRGAERQTLKLGFAGPKPPPAVAAAGEVQVGEGEQVLEETAFGKRVGDTRWVLSRAAVMNYYQELLDNPDRIAALYMSMKPEYKSDEITGYRVNQEGEQDFFKAMGLKEGDVVRKVNSMNMTSQARAEYFIGEFVKNRLNAVVLDIERDGKPEKMIYLTR